MKKVLLILMCAAVLASGAVVMTGCDTDFPDYEYAFAATLALSLFVDGYTVDKPMDVTVDGDRLDIEFSLLYDELDTGHIIVDRKSGKVGDIYLDSGTPIEDLIAKFDDYVYDKSAADAAREEFEQAESVRYVRLGFVEPVGAEEFLTTYYPPLWDYIMFAPLANSANGSCAAGYWMFSRGRYLDFENTPSSAIGVNRERLALYKPTEDNLRKCFMPAERYEEIARRFGVEYDDDVKDFVTDFIDVLTDGKGSVAMSYAYHYSRLGENPVLGFSIRVPNKETAKQLMANYENVYLLNWA